MTQGQNKKDKAASVHPFRNCPEPAESNHEDKDKQKCGGLGWTCDRNKW